MSREARELQESYENLAVELAKDWAEKKVLVEEAIEAVLSELDDSGLPEVARYLAEGGKRFRGYLTLLAAEALGASVEEALDAAVAIELVQASSLAIDDIIDQDRKRRGKTAAWIVHGLAKTVLTSLLLIPVSQRMVEKLGFKALYHVIRAWEGTVRGEILDSIITDLIPPEKYLDVARLKTGSLFRLSLVLGALAARAPQEAIDSLAEYGEALGIIYQLADDIVDYHLHLIGEKPLEPGLRLFIRWARQHGDGDIITTAVKTLSEYISLAEKKASSIDYTNPRKGLYLKIIPSFLARKMLESAGLEHLLSRTPRRKD